MRQKIQSVHTRNVRYSSERLTHILMAFLSNLHERTKEKGRNLWVSTLLILQKGYKTNSSGMSQRYGSCMTISVIIWQYWQYFQNYPISSNFPSFKLLGVAIWKKKMLPWCTSFIIEAYHSLCNEQVNAVYLRFLSSAILAECSGDILLYSSVFPRLTFSQHIKCLVEHFFCTLLYTSLPIIVITNTMLCLPKGKRLR